MKNPIVVLSTVPSKKMGLEIAATLVKEKCAACVQVIPGLTSIYFWEGKIQQDKEYWVIIKTQKVLFAKVEKIIKKYHSYTVPQVVALPIVKGSSSYLQWMKNTLNSK